MTTFQLLAAAAAVLVAAAVVYRLLKAFVAGAMKALLFLVSLGLVLAALAWGLSHTDAGWRWPPSGSAERPPALAR